MFPDLQGQFEKDIINQKSCSVNLMSSLKFRPSTTSLFHHLYLSEVNSSACLIKHNLFKKKYLQHFPPNMWKQKIMVNVHLPCVFSNPYPTPPGSPRRCSPAAPWMPSVPWVRWWRSRSPWKYTPTDHLLNRLPQAWKSKGPALTPLPKCHVKTPRNWGWNRGFQAGYDRGWWLLIIPKNQAAYFFGQTWHCNGCP